jgi:uncharacterized protein (UPF0332 family)
LVKTGQVPDHFGRWLNQALELRSTGDYGDDSPDPNEADEVLSRTDAFLAAVKELLATPPPVRPRGRRA